MAFILQLLDSSNSLGLECIYSILEYRGYYGELLHEAAYTCQGTLKKDCFKQTSTVKAISKTHKFKKSRYDVVMLWFEGTGEQKISRIPSDLGRFFPFLEVLKVSFSNLETITSGDIAQFPHLKCLYIAHNELKQLPSDLFTNTPNIEFVAFDWNEIHFIGKNFFSYLKKVKIVYSFENPCTKYSTSGSGNNISEIKKIVKENCQVIWAHKGEEESYDNAYNEEITDEKTHAPVKHAKAVTRAKTAVKHTKPTKSVKRRFSHEYCELKFETLSEAQNFSDETNEADDANFGESDEKVDNDDD